MLVLTNSCLLSERLSYALLFQESRLASFSHGWCSHIIFGCVNHREIVHCSHRYRPLSIHLLGEKFQLLIFLAQHLLLLRYGRRESLISFFQGHYLGLLHLKLILRVFQFCLKSLLFAELNPELLKLIDQLSSLSLQVFILSSEFLDLRQKNDANPRLHVFIRHLCVPQCHSKAFYFYLFLS